MRLWKLNLLYSIILGCGVIQLSGCSSILHGTTQSVKISTSIDGQSLPNISCQINNNGKITQITTPQTVRLPRNADKVGIYCATAHYKMLHAEQLQRSNKLLTSAAEGAATAGATSAVVMLPVIGIPIIGVPFYLSVVGIGSLVGGTSSAGVDAATGGGYALPSQLDIPMISVTSKHSPQ